MTRAGEGLPDATCLSFPFAPPTHSSQWIAGSSPQTNRSLRALEAREFRAADPRPTPLSAGPRYDSPLRRPNADPPTAAPAHRGAARPRPRPRRLRGRSRLPLCFLLRKRINDRGGRGEK